MSRINWGAVFIAAWVFVIMLSAVAWALNDVGLTNIKYSAPSFDEPHTKGRR